MIETIASTLLSFVSTKSKLLIRSFCWQLLKRSINIFPTDFLFPKDTTVDQMKVCEQNEMKLFCKDYVERAEVMFILATVSCALVILSLVRSVLLIQKREAL